MTDPDSEVEEGEIEQSHDRLALSGQSFTPFGGEFVCLLHCVYTCWILSYILLLVFCKPWDAQEALLKYAFCDRIIQHTGSRTYMKYATDSLQHLFTFCQFYYQVLQYLV